MSKIRDNPFYFIFLNLISSGVKQLPVSYGYRFNFEHAKLSNDEIPNFY